MSEHESHCPFLNRSDYRCSNHFSLDKLDAAFDHCFGEYQACPTYLEMLDERRSRNTGHTAELTQPVVYATLTVRTRPAHVTVNSVRLPANRLTRQLAATAA
jgi:hypothetical protein